MQRSAAIPRRLDKIVRVYPRLRQYL